MRMRCGKILYFQGVTFLGLQSSMSLHPVLEKGQLWVQQRQREGQCPQLPFHGGAGSGRALDQLQSIVWSHRALSPVGNAGEHASDNRRARILACERETGQ